MRRSKPRSVLIIAGMASCLFGAANVLRAQEQTGAIEAPAEAEIFEVIGIAPSDLLNLRATASPNGMLIARVPNGSMLRNHGCVEANGNRWCKVADVDNPSVMGWAAERYLQASQAASFEPVEPAPTEEPGEYIEPMEGETPPG